MSGRRQSTAPLAGERPTTLACAALTPLAQIIQLACQGKTIPEIVTETQCAPNMVRKWFKRFSDQGLTGVNDAPRSGAPSRYTAEHKALVVATARTRPSDLGLALNLIEPWWKTLRSLAL